MEKQLVSVIIPTYNRSETIKNAINSVLQQSYQNLEVLLVDDASKDDTKQVVESIKDPRVQYYRNDKQMGANISRNVGITHAKGTYIAFCDSADQWVADKLEKQIKKMQETSSDIIFCAETVTNAEQTYIIPFEKPKAMLLQNRLLELLSMENCVDTSTLVVKKECFDQAGLFHLELPRLQEYEWMLRAAQKFKVFYLDEVLVSALIRKDSISSDVGKYCKAVSIIYRDHYEFFRSYGRQRDFLFSPIGLLYSEQATFDEYEKYFSYLKDTETALKERADADSRFIDWEDLYLSSFRFCFKKYYVLNFLAENKEAGNTLSKISEKKDSRFCIFGAKEICQRLCDWLAKHDRLSSVEAIIVTSCKDNTKKIDSIPMLEIAQCDQKLKELPIILAVSESIVHEVICEMKKYKFKKAVCLSEKDLQAIGYKD